MRRDRAGQTDAAPTSQRLVRSHAQDPRHNLHLTWEVASATCTGAEPTPASRTSGAGVCVSAACRSLAAVCVLQRVAAPNVCQAQTPTQCRAPASCARCRRSLAHACMHGAQPGDSRAVGALGRTLDLLGLDRAGREDRGRRLRLRSDTAHRGRGRGLERTLPDTGAQPRVWGV